MNPDARDLARFITCAGRVAVVTGAGVSTASGIPDYRDRNGEWKHAQPVQYADFIARPHVRRRYWARSFSGWQRIASAQPNRAHTALAKLESVGKVDTVITQNVDGLHHRAGSRRVIDLHGRLQFVRCMGCGSIADREEWQHELAAANPQWRSETDYFAPDGDAKLRDEDVSRFVAPDCPACGGFIKPDVVFFGETVPRDRVESAFEALERADALLVIGSSLMVFSGYRFARRAAETGKPIAIVNRGRTRADDLAALRIDADCADVLDRVSRIDG